MRRLYEQNLLEWMNGHDRKPLILRGARQVGKSTLVRLFAENNGYNLVEINLEIRPFQSLKSENFYIEDWIHEIEAIANKKINSKTIIFLDEIQAQAIAINRLRYFYEERPDIAVIAAGSLLDITLHNEEISFPVGRVGFLWISPMTFGEYLIAIGREEIYQSILNKKLQKFHEPILKEEVKKYFFIGGMPKAIKTYLETKSFIEVRKIQQEILEAYRNDFPKYSKRINVDRIHTVFRQVPTHLGQKLIYQHLDTGSKSIEVKKCVELLLRANVLTPCYHTDANGVPLVAGIDYSIQKIYFLDIGLVNCIHEFTWNNFSTLFEESFPSKGYLAEQFVAQHLSYLFDSQRAPQTLYWLRDKSIKKAEVDFLLTNDNEILPLEVKSEKGGMLKSLIVFSKEKKIKKAIKLSKDWFSDEKIKLSDSEELIVENIPYYAIEGLIKSLS